MKKLIIILFIFVFRCTPVKTFAVDYEQETENLAEEYNINRDKISDITPYDLINYVTQQIEDKRTQPLKLTLRLSGIILLCRVVKVLSDNKGADTVTDTVCVLIIFLSLLEPVQSIITAVSQNLIDVKNFMLSFLPLYSGIAAASGEIFTSAIYSGFFLSGIIFISGLCIDIILPSVQLYFALIVSNSLSNFVKLKSISDFYLKSVKWVMRSIVSVICFVLTMQTTLASGKENLAVKAGKALAGSAIPVIGSVLQDAVGSVYAGMEAIKGFAGVVGMLRVINIFLPSVILLAVYWLSVNMLFIICDIFEMKEISECVKGFVSIIELLLSVIFLFIILLVFSLTIMINLTKG